MNTEKFWVLAFIAATILWGWSFSAIHETLNTVSASSFNAYRFLVGAAVMAIILIRQLSSISFLEWRDGGLAGLVLFLAFTFQTLGISYTTASNASFITGLAVVFTPVFARIILKQYSNKQQITGAVVAAIGLGFLTINDFSVHLGDALVLLCAVFFALHIVVLSKSSKIRDVAVLAFIQMLVVGVLSLVWAYSTRQLTLPHTDQAISTILIMGVFGTALAYFVQTKAQVLTSPNKIAMILVLEPVFGGLFGYLAGDRLTSWNMLGAALIVLAMLVTEAKLKTK